MDEKESIKQKMQRRSWVYVTGGREGDPEKAAKMEEAAKKIEALGLYAVVPSRMEKVLPPDASWTDTMAMCRALMQICDFIYFLPGYEENEWSWKEARWAREYNIGILEAGI